MFARSLIIVALFLAACGGSGTRVGVITTKEYTPAHDQRFLIPFCAKACFFLPIMRHVDDHYDFKLRDCRDDEHCDTGEVAVDHETFDSYHEGDVYDGR